MSCYICADHHFAYLAKAAFQIYGPGSFIPFELEQVFRGDDEEDGLSFCEHLLAQAFCDANYRSYNFRYSHHDDIVEDPEDWELSEEEVGSMRWVVPLDYYQVYKSIGCWQYQSCEHPDHKNEPAWRVSEWMKRKIEEVLMRSEGEIDQIIYEFRDKYLWGAPEPIRRVLPQHTCVGVLNKDVEPEPEPVPEEGLVSGGRKDQTSKEKGSGMMTQNEYLNLKGTQCPCCDSEDLDGGFVEVDAGTAHQEIVCLECGERWIDRYTLAGFELMEEESK